MSDPTLKDYPQPRSHPHNRPLIEGWKEGKLLLQHCGDCGAVVFYPRQFCPDCWSDALEWRQASGRGTVVSYSLVHRPNMPVFLDEVPIVLAEVKLAEGPPMLTRIVHVDAGTVYSGMPVEVVAPDEAARYPLPTFRPATL
ncbi:Zn-ribbon domain-containing OB-fold protein [Acuticoccus kandeliae]|uniref:Zn-ribbon domain-containing OB-fold protein n=1 Tax=Acuticoccus kandeliae TaxID=2073160 RepID=UPI000D3E6BA2|nr:Zn-ribbon domain-containing OB-fold protein [Acuticoccus kandeliae]